MTLLGGSQRAREDRLQLFRSLLLFWLLAAIDGHAKNVSLSLGVVEPAAKALAGHG